MPTVFITGCPGAGKSTLGRRLAQETGATQMYIDGLKKVMAKNPSLKPWVYFFSRLDEAHYWRTTDAQEHWLHMVAQSDAFWPHVKPVIEAFVKKHDAVIVDGANMMPHLVARDYPHMKGVVLLPPSRRELLRRLQTEPRWSRENPELLSLEAKRYWQESKRYARAARRYGYPVFRDADKAFAYLKAVL